MFTGLLLKHNLIFEEDMISKVESKADKISTELKNIIFSNKENGLATKVHLRYFVEIMDEVANLSEDVADRLIISSSKN